MATLAQLEELVVAYSRRVENLEQLLEVSSPAGGGDGSDAGGSSGGDGGDSGSGDFGGGSDSGASSGGSGGDFGSPVEMIGGDSATPVTITIAADGSVTYDFSGKVHAQGLTLDEGVLSTDTLSSVVWNDSGGINREIIVGYFDAVLGTHRLAFIGGASGTRLFLDSLNNAINVQSGLKTALLFDNTGSSDFLRFLGSSKATVDGGTGTAATNGVNSATLVVNHNLGVVPVVALATPRGGGNVNPICQVRARSNTTITVQVAHRDAGTTFTANMDFDWLAIG